MENLNTFKRNAMFQVGKVLVDSKKFEKDFQISESEVSFFATQLEKYGYKISESAQKRLQHLRAEDFLLLVGQIVKSAMISKGANYDYKILMKDYENYHVDGTEEEITLNAVSLRILNILDFLSDGNVMEKETIKPKASKSENSKMFQLDLIDEKGYENYINAKLKGKASFSIADKELIKHYIDNEYKEKELEFSNNENMVFVYSLLFEKGIKPHFNTLTNAIRFIKEYYKKDVKNNLVMLRKLNSADRKNILEILNSFNVERNTIADAKQEIGFLKTLNKVLHALSETNQRKYKNAYGILNTIFNDDKKYRTVNSKIEELIKNKDEAIFEFIKNFAGIFIKRVGQLYQVFNGQKVLDLFTEMQDQFDLEQLISLKKYFENIQEESRAFVFNGKAYSIENKEPLFKNSDVKVWLEKIDNALHVVLKSKQSKADNKIFVLSDAFDSIATPQNTKTITNLQTLTTGSNISVPFDDKLVIFSHWKHGAGSVDVDLSATFYDESLRRVGHIAYHQLTNKYAIHSGDVRTGSQGDSEFITIYKNKLPENVRYVSASVNLFASSHAKSFEELDESLIGLAYDFDKKNFNPANVEYVTDFKVKTSFATPFIYDLKLGKLVYVNFAESNGNDYSRVSYLKEGTLSVILKDALNRKTGVGELVKIYAKTNGYVLLDLTDGVEYVRNLGDEEKEKVVVISSTFENSQIDFDVFEKAMKFNERQVSQIINELKNDGFNKPEEKEVIEKVEKTNELSETKITLEYLKNILKTLFI